MRNQVDVLNDLAKIYIKKLRLEQELNYIYKRRMDEMMDWNVWDEEEHASLMDE